MLLQHGGWWIPTISDLLKYVFFVFQEKDGFFFPFSWEREEVER